MCSELIYDESGIVIGETRPLTEPTDVYLCEFCNEFHTACTICVSMPDILDEDVLPESGLAPEHDPHTYVVFEAENIYDRTQFILDYLAARDSNAARIRDSW